MKRCLSIGLALLLVAGCSRAPESKPEAEGKFMTPTEMAAKADVPLYPDSEAPDGKSFVKETDKESRYELVMTTSDAPDKVLAFYRGKLQNAQKGMGGIMGSSPKGNSVTVTAAPEGGKTSVHVIAITFK